MMGTIGTVGDSHWLIFGDWCQTSLYDGEGGLEVIDFLL